MEQAAVEDLRNVIKERLTAAAEEIFGAFRTTISVYEEELHRHRKLLDVVLQPQIKLPRIELQQQDVSKDNKELKNQKTASSPDQENAQSPRVKEEPREFCSPEGEGISPKREDDSKSTCEHSHTPFFSGRQREAEQSPCVSNAKKTSETYNNTEPNSDPLLLIHTSHGANNQYGRNVSHSNNTVPEDKEKGSFPSSYNMRFDVTQRQNDEDQQMQVLTNRAWTANHQPKLLEKHFRCSRCSQDFDSKTQLDLHMKTHTGQIPSSAHGSQFGIQHYFTQTVTQSAKKSHVCMRCGKTFPHEQALQMHMTNHPGCLFSEEKEGHTQQLHINQDQGQKAEELCGSLEEKPFALKTEDDSLSSFQSISGHNSDIWPPLWNSCQSQREVESNFTDSFNTRFGFEGNSCGVPNKPHKCGICSESFDLPSQLQSHVTVHATERPFSCSVCGRRFSVKGYLTKHMKTHSGVKPHPCVRCGKTFRRLEHLRTHMRGHTGEKLYSCQFCGKEFAYQTSYTYHIRVHTGEKPFECSLCGKKFAVSASLTAHTRKHTGEKPYVCQICGKAFAIKTALKMHIKTHMREVQVLPLEETFENVHSTD